jgi:hypothetical protein
MVSWRIRDAHHHSLVTYRNGWRKYLGFCAIFDVPPLSPGVPWPDMFECFLLYAVQDALRKIAPGTANEYVSHVLKHLEHEGFWSIRESARSPRYTAVHHALVRDHAEHHVFRTEARIPFTVPFIIWSLHYIDRTYDDPAERRLQKAILAAGHAFSLRPGEYLKCPQNYAANRFIRAGTTFAWFNGEAFAAYEPHTWPPGVPSHISSALDVRKNSLNKGGLVAVAANPEPPGPDTLCCASILADYIRFAGLAIQDPLFCRNHVHADSVELSAIMKTCAQAHDVDPDRIMPASLRKNVLTQMDLNTPQLQRMLQGGWRSRAGEDSYWTHLLQVADANQHAVHHAGGATISVIRTIFGRTLGDVQPAVHLQR